MSGLPLWKDIEETKILRFDFAADLETGDTISVVVLTVDLTAGTDPSPGTLLTGVAQVIAGEVLQRITAGVQDATYHVRARATDSAGLVHVRAADLQVVRL